MIIWQRLMYTAEHMLGLGVTSTRSALGRRIQQVLRGGRIRSVPQSWRVVIAGGLGLAALVTAVTLFFPPPVPGFSWAKVQGFTMQPVRVVSLRPAWLGRLEGVPPGLSPRDLAITRACQGGGWPFTASKSVANRHRYEELVAQYPHAFYPEYCLAEWFLLNKQTVPYQYWEQRALHDAPRVLAGRIVDDDGKPLAGARDLLWLSTYDPRNLRIDRAVTNLESVTTDQEGCFYIPVFRGIYSNAASPGLQSDVITDAQGQQMNSFTTGGRTSDWGQQGPNESLTYGMIARSHVGVLPKIIARPPIAIISQAGQVQGSQKHPVLIRSNRLDLAWKPVSGANLYSVFIETIIYNPFSKSFLFSSLAQRSSQETHMSIRLNGTGRENSNAPLFDRAKVYQCIVNAFRSSYGHSTLLNASRTFYFSPTNAVAPLALTPAAVAQQFGAGTVVTSITDKNGIVTISGTAPNHILLAMDGQDTFAIVGKLFGLTWEKAACGPVTGAKQGSFQATYYR